MIVQTNLGDRSQFAVQYLFSLGFKGLITETVMPILDY